MTAASTKLQWACRADLRANPAQGERSPIAKRAALYARVSTDRQKEEATIASQVDEIRRRIEADGHRLSEDCVFTDDGYSGELLVRPGLDRLRDTAQRGRIDLLYVYDRGRLSRKFAYQELLIDELHSLGVAFVTLHDAPAETPEERVLQAMQGVFHEYERVKITDRMRRGKLYKVRSGRLLGHLAPYGYTYVPKTRAGEGGLQVNEIEADVVRRIFAWVGEDGATVREVVRRLSAAGIPPRNSRAVSWSTSTVSRVLRNETYVGIHHYQKTRLVPAPIPEDPTVTGYRRTKRTRKRPRERAEWIPVSVPALISQELFERVQGQLRENAYFAQRNARYSYLLQGVIYCPCGKRRGGSQSSGYRYYRCTDARNHFPLPATCAEPPVQAEAVERAVWETLVELLQNPDLIRDQAARWLAAREETAREEAVAAREEQRQGRERDKLRQEEERYARAYGQGLLTDEVFAGLMADLGERRSRLEAEAVRSPAHKTSAPPPLEWLARAIPDTLQSLCLKDRQQVVRSLCSRITANRDQIVIEGLLSVPTGSGMRSTPKDVGNTMIPFEITVPYSPPRRQAVRQKPDLEGGSNTNEMPARRCSQRRAHKRQPPHP